MNRPFLPLCAVATSVFSPVGSAEVQDPEAPFTAETDEENVVRDPALFDATEYQLVGPYRGGRVTAANGYPDRTRTYLMCGVGGGVWKITDGEESWNQLTNGFSTDSVGKIGLVVSGANPLWVCALVEA
jgi:hypothetical protein